MILADQMPGELPPSIQGVLHGAVGEVGQDSLGAVHVAGLVQLQSLGLDLGLLLEHGVHQLAALLRDLLVHGVPAELRPVVHQVEGPPGAVQVEVVAVAGVPLHRDLSGAGVDGNMNGGVGGVLTEPQHGTDLGRQPVTALGHEAVGALLHSDGAGPRELGNLLRGITGGQRVADRGAEGTSGQASGGIIGGALVVVAIDFHQLLNSDLLVRNDRERIGQGSLLAVGDGQLQGGGDQIEHAPHTGGAGVADIADSRVGDQGPVEVLTLAPLAKLLGIVRDVGGPHEVLGVLEVDHADVGTVGTGPHLIIGNSAGNPVGAGGAAVGSPQGARTDDLEDPHFIGISNSQALAAVGVAVLLSQGAHDLDALSGGGGALQTQHLQVGDHEQRLLTVVEGGVVAAPGVLADGDTLLIEAGIAGVDIRIGLGDLGDLADLLNGINGIHAGVAVDLHDLTLLMGAAGDDLDTVVIPAVTGVGHHRGPIRSGVLAGSDNGTGVGHHRGREGYDGHNQTDQFLKSFHSKILHQFAIGNTFTFCAPV